MVKNLRAASPRAKWKIEAPTIIVLSTSKNAAAVRSVSGTSAGPLSPAATAAAAAASPARFAGSADVADSTTPGVSAAPLSSPEPVGVRGSGGSSSPTTCGPPVAGTRSSTLTAPSHRTGPVQTLWKVPAAPAVRGRPPRRVCPRRPSWIRLAQGQPIVMGGMPGSSGGSVTGGSSGSGTLTPPAPAPPGSGDVRLGRRAASLGLPVFRPARRRAVRPRSGSSPGRSPLGVSTRGARRCLGAGRCRGLASRVSPGCRCDPGSGCPGRPGSPNAACSRPRPAPSRAGCRPRRTPSRPSGRPAPRCARGAGRAAGSSRPRWPPPGRAGPGAAASAGPTARPPTCAASRAARCSRRSRRP